MRCGKNNVEEAGRESFPASDPPAWTLGIEPKGKRHGNRDQRCEQLAHHHVRTWAAAK